MQDVKPHSRYMPEPSKMMEMATYQQKPVVKKKKKKKRKRQKKAKVQAYEPVTSAELAELIKKLAKSQEQSKLAREYKATYESGHVLKSSEGEIIGGGPYPWQCVSGRQMIQMSDGSLKSADMVEPGDSVLSWDQINGRTTPGLVSVVARKMPARLVRVYFSTSETLEAAMDHRLLTTEGWQSVSSCIRYKDDGQHPPYAHASYDRISKQISEGSQGDCQTSPCSCDGHSRPPLKGDRASAPPRNDAPSHSHPPLRHDDPASTAGHSHDCQTVSDSQHSSDSACCCNPVQSSCTTDESYLNYIQTHSQSHEETGRSRGVVGVPIRVCDESLVLPCYSPSGGLAYPIAYEILGPETLYDFEVEGWHNYITGGVVNHNCEFHNAGKDHDQRMLCCANQVGKSRSAAAEVAIHMTGLYPDWWEGKRFDHPVEALVCNTTNEECRNINQRQLVGKITEDREPDGTGWIPKHLISKATFRQCGVPNVIDTCEVKHVSGGTSTFMQKSYEQGVSKFEGVQYDLCWLDEEPEDSKIWPEIQTRMIVKSGHILFSRTPLFGMTDMVRHFLEGGIEGCYSVIASLDDAPHMTKQMKDKYLSRWPHHERDTRARGIPMLGEGAVYPISDEQIICEPFEIPGHYRKIVGIDFGISHPFSAVWAAYDGDNDIVYLYGEYEAKDQTPPVHAAAIRARGKGIPVSWPHDGAIRDKGSGRPLAEQYAEHELNMLGASARIHDDKGGGQSTEAIVNQMLERMHTGRLKVFPSMTVWLRQKKMYHRKQTGTSSMINRINDDMIAASHYAVMMLRYAQSSSDMGGSRPVAVVDDYDVFSGYSA